jgi:hypothetical protein
MQGNILQGLGTHVKILRIVFEEVQDIQGTLKRRNQNTRSRRFGRTMVRSSFLRFQHFLKKHGIEKKASISYIPQKWSSICFVLWWRWQGTCFMLKISTNHCG